jgi:hypothetical protein
MQAMVPLWQSQASDDEVSMAREYLVHLWGRRFTLADDDGNDSNMLCTVH